MHAKRFHGAADGPDRVVDRATNGTPLEHGRGWTCGSCEAIWAAEEYAEVCCVAPGDAGAVRSIPAHGRWLRLYTPR